MEEEVESDLQVVGVRRWRELVTDTKKWKDIFRHTKAHSGLWCEWKKKKNKKKGKTQEKMERGSRKRSSSAGSEKMERVGGR